MFKSIYIYLHKNNNVYTLLLRLATQFLIETVQIPKKKKKKKKKKNERKQQFIKSEVVK